MLKSKEKAMPGPTYMSDVQKAEYLQTLRTSTRPSGSRPPPPSKFTSSKPRVAENGAHSAVQTSSERPIFSTSNSMPNIPVNERTHSRSESSTSSRAQYGGRPLARPPSTTSETDPIPPAQALHYKPSKSYVERGSRWMERQESHSLRRALEDMDQDEEHRLYASAQDEAAELVWKHQNPDDPSSQPHAPYHNPDIRPDYHSHLRKGSYQRSQSEESAATTSLRKTSGGSHEQSTDSSLISLKRRSIEVMRKVSPPSNDLVIQKKRTPSGKSYGGLAEAVADDIANAHRRSSSGSRRILSGEKKRVFMHPNDQIWEDPSEELTTKSQVPDLQESVAASQPAGHVRMNPFARVRRQAESLERSRSEPIVHNLRHDNIEIQKNPPSQSRRPWYMSNTPLPPSPTNSGGHGEDEVAPKTTPTRDGLEIRDDDIRAATSKKRNEYSAKLPRPTMVSDKPGRPIVSFEEWKPKEVVLEGIQAALFSEAESIPSKTRQPTRASNPSPSLDWSSSTTSIPQINVEETQFPPIPTIVIPDEPDIPSIVLPEESDSAAQANAQSEPVTPVISIQRSAITTRPPEILVSDSQQRSASTMPFTQPWPTAGARRPLPTHASTEPIPHSQSRLTLCAKPAGTLCAHCGLSIAGRILSAGGERFHPACFVCHGCHTNLELVAFYPEPEKARRERLARIEARFDGAAISIDELMRQEAVDGDGALRFYCHLDFHELFSPRCKSCKTPIEGEVIVACGAEWHAGHFFCAQCGDPFDSSTPFVEKDGYAWCVRCHTNRFSSKCRKCKKPVTDTVVKALGYDWHADCFVCTECNSEFRDGRYFLRGACQDPVCVGCEQRRLKA